MLFELDHFWSRDEIQKRLERIVTSAGTYTNTSAAISLVTNQVLSTAAVARNNVPRIAIVLTDGKSQEAWKTAEAAKEAKASGIKMYAIGKSLTSCIRVFRDTVQYVCAVCTGVPVSVLSFSVPFGHSAQEVELGLVGSVSEIS